MQQGPADVVDMIEGRQMNLSVNPSLRNCYLFVVTGLGPVMLAARFVLMPLLQPLVLCRWLVLRSCRNRRRVVSPSDRESRAGLDSTVLAYIAGQAGSFPLTAAQMRRRQSTPFSEVGLGQLRSCAWMLDSVDADFLLATRSNAARSSSVRLR